jgi:putative sterol carrier protein
MPRYLSPEWIEALDRAAAAAGEVMPGVTLTVQQVVGDVSYHVTITDGRVRVHAGVAPDADVTFRQDAAVASAIARGERSAQAAFMAGELRVGGDLGVLMAHQPAFAALDDVFAAVRADTTFS